MKVNKIFVKILCGAGVFGVITGSWTFSSSSKLSVLALQNVEALSEGEVYMGMVQDIVPHNYEYSETIIDVDGKSKTKITVVHEVTCWGSGDQWCQYSYESHTSIRP